MEENGEEVFLYLLKSILDCSDIKRETKNQKDQFRLHLLHKIMSKLPRSIIHQLPTIIYKCTKDKDEKYFEILIKQLKLGLNDEIGTIIGCIYSSDEHFSLNGIFFLILFNLNLICNFYLLILIIKKKKLN